jgi:benzoyl-CoA 2,3-dioxygenase component B
MKQEPNEDVRKLGGLDLPTIQKYLNLWYSVSADLFGGEISTNAANYFGAGLKAREREAHYEDHGARAGIYRMALVENGRLIERDIALRNAMNEVLRDSYIEDCQRGCDRWNKVIERESIASRLKLPSRRFNRSVGIYAGSSFNPEGDLISQEEWQRGRDQWLPSDSDRAYVDSLMKPVRAPGEIANWVAPPEKGVNGKPFDFEYVRFH